MGDELFRMCEGRLLERRNEHTGISEIIIIVFGAGERRIAFFGGRTGLFLAEVLVFDFLEFDHRDL